MFLFLLLFPNETDEEEGGWRREDGKEKRSWECGELRGDLSILREEEEEER